MTKKRIQKEEKMKEAPTFGRPTLFGRPTSEARSYDASMTSSYRRVAIFGGHPTGFGRLTRPTSDMERTSDMKIFATAPEYSTDVKTAGSPTRFGRPTHRTSETHRTTETACSQI